MQRCSVLRLHVAHATMSSQKFPCDETFEEEVKIYVTSEDSESVASVALAEGADEATMLELNSRRIRWGVKLKRTTKFGEKTALLLPGKGETTWTVDEPAGADSRTGSRQPIFLCFTDGVDGLTASARGRVTVTIDEPTILRGLGYSTDEEKVGMKLRYISEGESEPADATVVGYSAASDDEPEAYLVRHDDGSHYYEDLPL